MSENALKYKGFKTFLDLVIDINKSAKIKLYIQGV